MLRYTHISYLVVVYKPLFLYSLTYYSFSRINKHIFFFYDYYPVVSIETWLWSGRSGVRIPAGLRYFSLSENCPDWPLSTPSTLFKGNRVFFRGKCTRRAMLTTDFHLAPRLRMNGAVLLLPLYTFRSDWLLCLCTVSLTVCSLQRRFLQRTKPAQ